MADETTESPFFRWWAELVLGNRAVFLLLTLGVTAFFLFQVVTGLRFDSSIEYFASGDVELSQTLEDYRDDFGRDDLYMVLVEGDVFSEPFLTDLRKLHTELEQLDLEVESLGERKADRDQERGWVEDAAPGDPETAQADAPPANDDFGDFGDFDDFGDFGSADDAWGDEAGGSLVEEVTSLINARQTRWQGGGIVVEGLLDEPPHPDDLPALKQRVLADDFLVGNVVGAEGRHALLMVRTDFVNEDDSHRINRTLAKVVAKYDRDGFDTATTGLPDINATLHDLIFSDITRLVGAAFGVMTLVLFVLFRHPLNVVGALGVVGMSSMWTLGMMTVFGVPVTILSNIIPAFLCAVGMGDSVHIQAVWIEQRRAGVPNHEAIVRAVASTGMPVVFTTLTTMAGLLSFWFASTLAIQEMGLAAAFGVFVALVHSVIFLPIVLSVMANRAFEPKPEHHRDGLDRFLERCTALSEGPKRWRVLAVAAVLVAGSLAGISQLEVYHNPLVWLGSHSATSQAVDAMDQHVGGTATVHVLIEAEGEYGLKDLELLQKLERFEQHALSFVHPKTGEMPVTDSLSILDVVKETNRALHQGDPAHYALPKTQGGVSDVLLMFENAGPDQLSRLATGDLRKSHITLRVHWMDASSYLPFRDHLEQGVDEIIGDAATVRTTGTVYSLLSVVGSLIEDLLKSFGVAFVAITLFMMGLLRNARLGLVSMVPNLLPVLLVFGFMGFTGIQIDMSNLLIASIIIGIAVDDTIHYLYQFSAHHSTGGTTNAAIQHALDHAGRALVSTSAILALGFSVYMASQLISIQRFGVLVGLTCVGALLIDLIITPALLRTVYPDPSEPTP